MKLLCLGLCCEGSYDKVRLYFQLNLSFHQQAGQPDNDEREYEGLEQSRHTASQCFGIVQVQQLLDSIPEVRDNVACQRCRTCGFDDIEPVGLAFYIRQPVEEAE